MANRGAGQHGQHPLSELTWAGHREKLMEAVICRQKEMARAGFGTLDTHQ